MAIQKGEIVKIGYKNRYFTLVLCITISTQMYAQNPYVLSHTNVARLNELSAEFHAKFEIEHNLAIQWSQQTGVPMSWESGNGSTIELIRVHDCRPEFYTTDNYNASITTSTEKIQFGGLTGFNLSGVGITAGIWDGGAVRFSHVEFGDRVTILDDSDWEQHATHVAGTMIAAGLDPAARGMAVLAMLESRGSCDDSSEMSTAGAAGMLVSNHSYSSYVGWEDNIWFGDSNISSEDYNFGFYNDKAQEWDDIAYNAPYYLIVKSAGNNRNDFGPFDPQAGHEHYMPDGIDCPQDWVVSWHNDFHSADCGPDGYDCVPTYGNAKNIVTVGAVQDILPDGYSSPEDVVIMDFSSFGPTDDGRIKPDIVANGDELYSTSKFSPGSYYITSGTSMAAPNVSGSIILLQEHYKNTNNDIPLRADAMKALILHTTDEAGDFEGPDYKFGWGLLNTKKAAMVIKYDNGNINELTLNNGGLYEIQIESDGSPLRVTLCWTDPAGTPPEVSLDPDTKMLVNDLDLRLEKDGQTFYPYVLDPLSPENAPSTSNDNDRDNVEQVYLATPLSGYYTIKVNHKNTLENGSQNFLLLRWRKYLLF